MCWFFKSFSLLSNSTVVTLLFCILLMSIACSIFLTKASVLGVLFSTLETYVFVAKLLISGLLSAVLIYFFFNSLTLLLKALACNNPLISGIFNSKLPTLVS